MQVEIGRVRKIGAATYLLVPPPVFTFVPWRPGDRIAIRVAGDKLVIERIALESLAVLRGAEAGVRP